MNQFSINNHEHTFCKIYSEAGRKIEDGRFKDALEDNLAVLFQPFLPFSSQKIADWLNLNNEWKPQYVKEGLKISNISILFKRLDKKVIEEERSKLGII
ncbi:MAG: hypothetical protein GX494_03080 [Clostridiaceae bacterium]|nr:hypothetical protein [Clostridiaceae bacterium]